MTTPEPIALTTNIAEVAGVGTRRAAAFRRLGLRCVADLLVHLPLRYEHELAEQSIHEADTIVGAAHGDAANITVRGEIATARLARGRRSRFEATLEDTTGTVQLTWFNAPWMQGRLHPGMRIRATGRAKRYGDYLQLVNPTWERIDAGPEEPDRREGRLRPVYPASEELTSRVIENATAAILDAALAGLEDHLPAAYRARRGLPELAAASRMMHRPDDGDEVASGRRRLAFDELLMLQLGVMLKRRHRQRTLSAPPLPITDAIDERITARFPFTLTDDQRAVIDEIVGDLAEPFPMNRLLQGDVGAGKTVVALYAMLVAVAAGEQAALMAPTELLAEQHHASIEGMLAGSNVTCELLTGSLPAGRRNDVLARLEGGAIDLLVGTHALLTETVQFRRLAVVVIDEQHRFGVHQRATMRAKSDDPSSCPHTLVMTATPIPRTLSLTIFGDLDVSTIRTLPPGRRPVVTRHAPSSQSGEIYALVDERIGDGAQAYIVVPAIEESDLGLTDVKSHLESLARGPLAGRRLAGMHGRQSRSERAEIMASFRAGAVDALVATTVIEVGVDVPNATIMVIEHAERFGLAQLHQLRGRVGRGAAQSVCLLLGDPATDDARARLEAIVGSTNGFDIAERDLAIRGPGEVLGARQSGLAPFRAARLPDDTELLRLARRDAAAWIDENPTLTGERDALLRKRLLKAHGEALGLADVG